MKHRTAIAAIAAIVWAQGCTRAPAPAPQSLEPAAPETAAPETAAPETAAPAGPSAKAATNVYFGNFHVHTSYSFDAYTNGSVTTPSDAYRWAKGEAIPGGGHGAPDFKIEVPLDWYMVSDHAEYLGVFGKMEDPKSPMSKHPIAKRITSDNTLVAFSAYSEVLDAMGAGKVDPSLSNPKLNRTIWQEVVATADEHYEPGKFTTFPGFEWTSHPGKRNIHRVVVFRDSQKLPEQPFSVFDSDKPEDLWKWMDALRANGTTLLAIPHNGNASDGLMFPMDESYGGSAVNKAYAETRMRNEPLYEITQIKGTSETHPKLSPNDEFANFELWDYTLSADAEPPKNKAGGYARDAFLRGIALERQGRGNPFKFGLIGDSDTHNSASAIEEDNYTGKFGMENQPAHRLDGPEGFPEKNKQQIREFGSGGVAALWAEQNTRESLFAALQRKETYGTSGPRMKLRVFAGYGFGADALDQPDWVAKAYRTGVPMGGDLKPQAGVGAPTLLIAAMKEPDGANLDRVQVIKGWIEGDKPREKIYDVALSDDRKADATGTVPPVGNTVDSKTATYTNDIGAPQLSAVWSDPDFDAKEHAFYYVRVLQIPTPRWSTYDSVKLKRKPRKDLPVSIQERAWSSPIWFTP